MLCFSFFFYNFCCFQSATPDFNITQKSHQKKHSHGLIISSDSLHTTKVTKGPLTAPVIDAEFVFTQQQTKLEKTVLSSHTKPDLSVTPATPVVDRKDRLDMGKEVIGIDDIEQKDEMDIPKKYPVNRTSSLPLVNTPLTDVAITEKSQSEEDFRAVHSESEPSSDVKENETVVKDSLQTQPMQVRKYSLKGFKKKMKKQKKKKDKSKESVGRGSADTNGNDIVAPDIDSVFQDDSRSETDDNTLSEDDIISPNEEKIIQAKQKEGFFRRMSVKVKNFVRNDDDDDSEDKKQKKKEKVFTVNDLTDETITKKPVLHKMTVKDLHNYNGMLK